MKELELRSWRVTAADPSGSTCWFDPSREQLKLFELDPGAHPGVHEVLRGDDQLGLLESDQEETDPLPPGEGLPF